jgi:hypothetical protein
VVRCKHRGVERENLTAVQIRMRRSADPSRQARGNALAWTIKDLGKLLGRVVRPWE